MRLLRVPAYIVFISVALVGNTARANVVGHATSPLSSAVSAVSAVSDAHGIRAVGPPARKKRTVRPAPDPRRAARMRGFHPGVAGLAAAGGAAGGTVVGGGTVMLAGLVLSGAFAPPTLPVVLTASTIAIGAGLATPLLAGVGAGGALLLADPRSTAQDWSSLMACAGTGMCAGLELIAAPASALLCGALPCGGTGWSGTAAPPPGVDAIPGPDEPAPWTAGAAIAGVVGGGVLGGLVGWSVAPSPDDPLVPIGVGALVGAVLGSSISAGTAAAIATSIRRPPPSRRAERPRADERDTFSRRR